MYKLSRRGLPGFPNSRILGSSYTWIYINRIRKGANTFSGKSRLLVIPLIIMELLVNCTMLIVFLLTICAYLIFNMLFRLPARNRGSVFQTSGH